MSDTKSRTRTRTDWSVLGVLTGVNPWTQALLALAQRIEFGQLSLVLPDGTNRVFTGNRHLDVRAVLNIRRPEAVRKLLLGGTTGFGEAYIDGDWDTPDLSALLKLALVNEPILGKQVQGVGAVLWLDRLRHRLRANTQRGSQRNIAFHYDLGNDFYGLWLDPGMTYSSAVFTSRDQSLEAAQDAKNRQLAKLLDLQPGHEVLEIGCGWGGFALMAARDHGCRVTAITLSREQQDYTRERLHEAGLAERVDVRLQDYRDVTGTYDRVASIEMLEAVGEEYWSTYFDVVRDRLKPSGVAGLQVITIEDSRFEQYRHGTDFIQRHIFPGGMLPSPAIMSRRIADAGLRLTETLAFAESYAETLGIWQRRFQHAWPQIRDLGFDARFKRMWEFYLAYCEAGFRTDSIDVAQYRIVRA